MTDAPIQLSGTMAEPAFGKDAIERVTQKVIAALEGDPAQPGVVYWGLVEALRQLCGAVPLMVLDVGETVDMIETFNETPVDENDAEAVADALLSLRPNTEAFDDVTWTTQLARLRENPQPLEWWTKVMQADDDYPLSDGAWEDLDYAKKLLIESAVEHMVEHPDDFTMEESDDVQA